jgi:hypothetical protein
MRAMDGRPVGHRPESGRSDWTEQDLLTKDEALPRLEEAIVEVEADYDAERDEQARAAIKDRLEAMRAARDRLQAQSG